MTRKSKRCFVLGGSSTLNRHMGVAILPVFTHSAGPMKPLCGLKLLGPMYTAINVRSGAV
jgi:hypothetical protein